jgi:hypothetical protein
MANVMFTRVLGILIPKGSFNNLHSRPTARICVQDEGRVPVKTSKEKFRGLDFKVPGVRKAIV